MPRGSAPGERRGGRKKGSSNKSNRDAPHLRDGEVAIVDPGDCDLQHGELYAVAYSRGPKIMQAVWHTTDNVTTWWAMNLNRPRGLDEFDVWMRAGRTIPAADGPYRPGGLEERI